MGSTSDSGGPGGTSLVIDSVDDFLAHMGVKGMRWGVRRHLSKIDGAGARKAFLTEYDKKWLAKIEKNPKLGLIGKRAAREASKQTRKLKKEYKASGMNIKKDKIAKSRYERDLKVALEGAMETAAYRTHKFSPSRVLEVQVTRNSDWSLQATVVPRVNAKLAKQTSKIVKAEDRRVKATVKADAKAAKAAVTHADIAEVTVDDLIGMAFDIPVDEEGFALDVTMVGEDLVQDDLDVDDFLVHHGIKGMRWGVRKQGPSAGRSAPPAKVSSKKASAPEGKPVIGKSGRIVTAPKRTVTVVGKKTGHSMSDEELRKAINRIDMERKFTQLTKAPPSKQHAAMKFVADILADVGKQQAKVLLGAIATKQMAKRGLIVPKAEKKKE